MFERFETDCISYECDEIYVRRKQKTKSPMESRTHKPAMHPAWKAQTMRFSCGGICNVLCVGKERWNRDRMEDCGRTGEYRKKGRMSEEGFGVVNFIGHRPICLGRPRRRLNQPGKAPNRSTRYHGGR